MEISFRADDETSGVFFKSTEYALYVKVRLTPQECESIKKAGIEKQVLFPYEYKGTELNYTVSSVVHSSGKGGESRFVAPNAKLREKLHKFLLIKLEGLEEELR